MYSSIQRHLSDFYVILYAMYGCVLLICFVKERWWWSVDCVLY